MSTSCRGSGALVGSPSWGTCSLLGWGANHRQQAVLEGALGEGAAVSVKAKAGWLMCGVACGHSRASLPHTRCSAQPLMQTLSPRH